MAYFFLTGGVFIGMVAVLDSILLAKEKGVCGKNSFMRVTTALEFFYALISIYVLFFSGLQQLFFISAFFVFYNVLGWGYGFYLSYKQGLFDDLSQGRALVIPMWYAWLATVFGVIFSLLCFTAL